MEGKSYAADKKLVLGKCSSVHATWWRKRRAAEGITWEAREPEESSIVRLFLPFSSSVVPNSIDPGTAASQHERPVLHTYA